MMVAVFSTLRLWGQPLVRAVHHMYYIALRSPLYEAEYFETWLSQSMMVAAIYLSFVARVSLSVLVAPPL
jgi:hypothetical protein